MAVHSDTSDDTHQDEVARLHFNTLTQQRVSAGGLRVFPHDQFDIGRDCVQQTLGIQDVCISNHHLRLHCVMYGDVDQPDVTPMVYVKVLSMNTVILTRRASSGPDTSMTITRDDGHVLLNHRDTIQLTPQVWIQFEAMVKAEQRPTNPVFEAEKAVLATQYLLSDRLLGKGAYAAVYVASAPCRRQLFACKVVLQDAEFTHLRSPTHIGSSQATIRECEILKNLFHPNIVSIEKVIVTPYYVYIFQELAPGGDLLSYIDRKAPLSEPQAANITKQLLEAVKYLHENHVVHRDIKPENILMSSWKDGARVILADFGQSKTIADFERAAKSAAARRMHTMVGTVGYIAPEVLQQQKKGVEHSSGYSKAIDIWSVGCTATALMTGYPLFPDGSMTASECEEHLATLESDEAWKHIGHRGKTLIRGCLATTEGERLTAEEALQMPWFTHPHYKFDFDRAYQKAIRDWRPREHGADVIELLDTSSEVQKHTEQRRQNTNRSKYFARQQPASRLDPSAHPIQRRGGRPDELHASPAPGSYTPAPARKQHQPSRRSSAQQDALDAIANPNPPGQGPVTTHSLDGFDESVMSLPPRT